jgi:hypothetical protein
MTTAAFEHLSGEIAAVLAAADPIRIIPGNPEPLDEYRFEAERIAEHILRTEADDSPSDRIALVKVVRSVFQDQFEQRISKSEAKAIVNEIQSRRLVD